MGVGNVRVEEIVLTFPLMQCLYISPCITLFPTTIWTTKYSCVHVITAITPSSPLHAVQREDMNLTLQKCVTVWQLLFVQGLGIENGGIWEWEYQKKEQKTGKRREKGKQKKWQEFVSSAASLTICHFRRGTVNTSHQVEWCVMISSSLQCTQTSLMSPQPQLTFCE